MSVTTEYEDTAPIREIKATCKLHPPDVLLIGPYHAGNGVAFEIKIDKDGPYDFPPGEAEIVLRLPDAIEMHKQLGELIAQLSE